MEVVQLSVAPHGVRAFSPLPFHGTLSGPELDVSSYRSPYHSFIPFVGGLPNG